MNEFTKEELEDVEVIYRAFCGDGRVLTDFEQSIMKKLKVMVNNYCEHEKTVNIGGWVSKCVKCGMKFGDETQ